MNCNEIEFWHDSGESVLTCFIVCRKCLLYGACGIFYIYPGSSKNVSLWGNGVVDTDKLMGIIKPKKILGDTFSDLLRIN